MRNMGDARPQVLLVEDLDWLRAQMRDSLERHGYRVTEASDDLEAVAAAERERPALVVTEEELPTFDALLRRARECPALGRVPVAVVNPDAEEGTRYGDAHVINGYEQLELLLDSHARAERD